MRKHTLFMETTGVSAEKTAGEIVTALVSAGANQVNMEYEAGAIVGLRWVMRIGQHDALFAMPARVEPVYKILIGRRQGYLTHDVKEKVRDQARRVAWRQLLRWTQAQLAMIECGMTEAGEVFFPYLQAPDGRSIFDTFKDGNVKMLGTGDVQ